MTQGTELFEQVIRASVRWILEHPDAAAYLDWAHRFIPETLDLGSMSLNARERVQMAHWLATFIWNATPLPDNGFQPRPLPTPAASDPCPCGSGLRYGRCCSDLVAGMTPLPAEAIWDLLIDLLPDDALRSAIKSGAMPQMLKARVAERWLQEDRPGRVVALLEPLFAGPLAERSEDHDEAALDLLCDAYDRLDHRRKKLALLKRICAEGPSKLRSAAWQRIGAMQIDAGEYTQAQDSLKEAMRCDPNNPGVALLELSLLTAQGEDHKASERARFWKYRFRRLQLDMPGFESFLEQAIEDPQAAMLFTQAEALAPGMLALQPWVALIAERSLPDYRAVDRQRRGKETETKTKGLELRPPSPIQETERRWHRRFPGYKPSGIEIDLEDVSEIWQDLGWIEYLYEHPECADSLDVLDDLTCAIDSHPDADLPWVLHNLSLPLLERAWRILEHSLPAQEPTHLPWVIPGNRPLLRLLFRRYLVLAEIGRAREAGESLETLLNLNPKDNQGARAELMNLYLRLGEDERAVALARRFPGDILADLPYGEVLALYRLGQEALAYQALKSAVRYLPRVPMYLMPKRIKQPSPNPRGVTVGGDEQAWLYRESMRDVWAAAPGALDWLKRCLGRGPIRNQLKD